MAKLLKSAARLSAPRNMSSPTRDPSSQASGSAKTVWRLGILRRFGSVQNIFAPSRLERLWRTLKHTASLRLLAAVFDAFSRAPLAVSNYDQKPGASAMARLLRAAVKTFPSPPKYLITDLGGEFLGKVFRKATSKLGIRAPRELLHTI